MRGLYGLSCFFLKLDSLRFFTIFQMKRGTADRRKDFENKSLDETVKAFEVPDGYFLLS